MPCAEDAYNFNLRSNNLLHISWSCNQFFIRVEELQITRVVFLAGPVDRPAIAIIYMVFTINLCITLLCSMFVLIDCFSFG
jgi:hypothetical protein